jgi:ketosteroid isomerase-like protein
MSQENVELAGQVMDAVAQRDVSRLIALTDPDVEWHSFFALGEGEGVYRGHARVQQYVSDLNDAWEIVRPEVDDTLEVGNLVVLVGRLHYRGKGSGVETEAPAGWVLIFRAKRVLYMRAFQEPEKALKAVGLSE